jgi:aryl-alcohol dehydrogenase-like predicted oxidoreductase
MQYTTLGKTGMKVSRLCLGTWNFGKYTDEKEACRIMDAALDEGINFFDTANGYPGLEQAGLSETIIGRWFALGNGRREKTVLATKVFTVMGDPYDGPNECHGLSLYKIRRHLEGSLKRLQTEHIELYQMHHTVTSVGWDELWNTFERAFLQGKIDYVGSCNFAGIHLMRAQWAADKHRFLGLVSEQHQYNLLCRLPELEVIPAVEHLGLGFLPYSPLSQGKLGGGRMFDRGKSKRSAVDPNTQNGKLLQERLDEYSKLCNELGETEAVVALAWLFSNPAVTAPIVGPRTSEQFAGLLRAVEVKLDEETLKKLDAIFPGPGGRAPEAYAW